jgi:hypothetical protein
MESALLILLRKTIAAMRESQRKAAHALTIPLSSQASDFVRALARRDAQGAYREKQKNSEV